MSSAYDQNYKIGYLGVLSFQSKVKLSNINLEIGDIPGIQANLENLSGDFSKQNLFIPFSENQANNLVLSQTEYSTISIEGTVEILNWQADQTECPSCLDIKLMEMGMHPNY